MSVLWNGAGLYQVKGPLDDQCVVSLDNKECTCRKWQLTGMPCSHGVAAIWFVGKTAGTAEMWVHGCYWLKTWKAMYNEKISPVNGRNLWPKSDCPSTLLPPKHKIQVGRPKKKRTRSVVESIDVYAKKEGRLTKKFTKIRCGHCHNEGHNSRSCKGQGGLVPNQVRKGKIKKRVGIDRGKDKGTVCEAAETGGGEEVETGERENVETGGGEDVETRGGEDVGTGGGQDV